MALRTVVFTLIICCQYRPNHAFSESGDSDMSMPSLLNDNVTDSTIDDYAEPSQYPTFLSTQKPTTCQPTRSPTAKPTRLPTKQPTETPTNSPTEPWDCSPKKIKKAAKKKKKRSQETFDDQLLNKLSPQTQPKSGKGCFKLYSVESDNYLLTHFQRHLVNHISSIHDLVILIGTKQCKKQMDLRTSEYFPVARASLNEIDFMTLGILISEGKTERQHQNIHVVVPCIDVKSMSKYLSGLIRRFDWKMGDTEHYVISRKHDQRSPSAVPFDIVQMNLSKTTPHKNVQPVQVNQSRSNQDVGTIYIKYISKKEILPTVDRLHDALKDEQFVNDSLWLIPYPTVKLNNE